MLSDKIETTPADQQSRFRKIADLAASFVETRQTGVLISLSLLIATVTFYLATQKLFWNDELFTLYFARLPMWPDLWRALSTGADQIPPTFVLLTKLSISIFGVNRISLRLPELLGFLMMCFFLYRIVSIRSSALHGFLAMVFPTMTEALHYSYEARGYGLVFGFSALAFYCWQRAAETERAILYRIGLGFGLCGAWMSHYYGLLLFFPIMVGEIVRTRMLKKLDPSMWMIFAASLLPILLFLPLIQASASYGQNFWAKPHWLDVFQFYDYLLHPVAIWTIFILISLSILGARHNHEIKPPEDSYPAYELAAITAFLLVPFIAMIAAKLTTGALTNRHLLFIVAGVSIIFAYALSYSRAPRSSLILALVLFVAGFFGKAGSELHRCNEDFAAYERTVNFVQTYPERSLPVACWVSSPVMQVWYYGPRELATRMFYLANPEDSVRYVGHDTIDRGLIDLKPWFPINNVQPYRLFVRSHKQFLLYYGSWPEDWVWNWIMSSLVADRMHIELKARQGDQYLFLVTSP